MNESSARPNSGNYFFHAKKMYGITPEQWDALYDLQNGRCMICWETFDVSCAKGRRKVNVDHDHNNNKIRGLLCHGCNVGLGYFRDNAELLRRAATYVELYA